jgi:hypothetical protein
MSCANKTRNSPHLTACLALTSPTPLVRPRITLAVPGVPGGNWRLGFNFPPVEARDPAGIDAALKGDVRDRYRGSQLNKTIDKRKQTVC